MADTKDYYLQNCQTIVPFGSVASGGKSKGASIIILKGISDALAMATALQGIITDYYSYNATGSTTGNMTNWVTGAAATACLNLATANAFYPNDTAGGLYNWITGLNSSTALNFEFGSTATPSSPEATAATGIHAHLITEQVAICRVKSSPTAIDATKLAIVVSSPGYRLNSTAYYRGVTKIATRFDNSACPATITVEAYPAILKENCVTGTAELILPGSPTTVISC